VRYIRVLINLPLKPAPIYVYHVPEKLNESIVFGKRVLVELGHKKVEGYIIDDNCGAPGIETKPVLTVLDSNAVLNHDLYELAQWLAEMYMCPLTLAINAMVPRKLTKKRDKVIVSQMTSSSLAQYLEEENLESNCQLLIDLFERGEMNYKEALKYTTAEQIKDLEAKELLYICGTYTGYREFRDDYSYLPNEANFDIRELDKLKRRAPRQAEIMQLLLERKSIPCKQLDNTFPASSIKSLLNRGFIKMEKPQQTRSVGIPELNQEQQKTLQVVKEALNNQQKQEFLLHGITGSGKTEVYIRAALSCIEQGRTVIMLVPEIALTRHLLEIFSERIPEMAVLHSKMSPSERYEEWKLIKEGRVKLVMGTRSAIFAPLSDIGLIIIDEEQEYTYKQEQQPRYHAREVARERARRSNAVLLMGSATPAVETFYASKIGQITRLSMTIRAGDAVLPAVKIENMRQALKKAHSPIISPLLETKLKDTLAHNGQAILFLNRRGFNPYTLCRSCGHTLVCPNCSVGLNYHKDINMYVCHYCGINMTIPNDCPTCGSNYMQQVGYGTQRVEEDICKLFPDARVARLDLDSSSNKGIQDKILAEMKQGKVDILIGTQMVAKGLDFTGVSLVGILDADGMLALPDFRSGERCFQLIVQAAGRAGRGGIRGEVIIQTYNPDNPIIILAAQQDYLSFFNEEIKWRKLLNYPPFSHILRLVIISMEDSLARQVADLIVLYIIEITDAKEDDIMIMGPAPCPMYRIKNQVRYQLLVKSENMLLLNSIGTNISGKQWHKQVKVEIDLNPLMNM